VDETIGQKRCAARHHDWNDAGHCRRPGCLATRTQAKPAPLMLSALPVDQMPKPTQAPKEPAANDPIAKLRAKVSPATPAQPDQVIPPDGKPKEPATEKDGEFFDEDFIPELGGPLIVSAHLGLTKRVLTAVGRKTEEVEDEKKDKASKKASAWLRLKLGKTITLGPTGQLVTALLSLSAVMYLESEPIAKPTAPPPPPSPKPAQPSAAPAPVAVTPSAPVGPTVPAAPMNNEPAEPTLPRGTNILTV